MSISNGYVDIIITGAHSSEASHVNRSLELELKLERYDREGTNWSNHLVAWQDISGHWVPVVLFPHLVLHTFKIMHSHFVQIY